MPVLGYITDTVSPLGYCVERRTQVSIEKLSFEKVYDLQDPAHNDKR